MATRGYFGGKSHSHPRLVRQTKKSIKTKTESGNYFCIRVVLSLDLLLCPQIWNAQKGCERQKEKVGDRPAKLNEKKSDRQLEGEIKDKGDIFSLEEKHKIL